MKSLFTLWCTACTLLISLSLFAQPPGDECSTAIPYPGDVLNGTCVTGFDFSSFTGTGENSPIATGDFEGDAAVWFSWTAPVTTSAGEPLHLSFDAGYYKIGIELYDADCLTPATNCLANVSGTVTGIIQGNNYLMLVWDDGDGATNCDFCLTTTSPPPANDECTGATPYPADVVNGTCVTNFDFTVYTNSGNSPFISCTPVGPNSAWFSWTAPVQTNVGDPIYLQFDNGQNQTNNCQLSLEFFSTDCLTPLSNCLFVTSGLISGLTQGTDYIMLVENPPFNNTICDFCLSIAPPSPPGDECSDPLAYPGDIANGNCVTGFDFTNFSNLGISPNPNCVSSQQLVWYTVTTPVTTNVDDPINLLFDGGNCFLGTQFFSLNCQDIASTCLFSPGTISGLLQGNDYLMAVGNSSGNNSCDFCLTVGPPPPPNDECTGAIPYPGDVLNGTCVTGFDFSPYSDIGIISPVATCDFGNDAAAWFSWTAPVTTAAGDPLYLNFDAGTDAPGFCFIGIEFYDTDCLTPISNCLPNQSGLIAGLTQGEDYLMLVWDDGSGDTNCDFCLTIAPPPPPGDECTDPLPYPGDIANGGCVTNFDFTGYTFTGISPSLNCVTTQQTVWHTITTPVTTAVGDPVNLIFDGGYCSTGVQFYSIDCYSPASNCVSNSGVVFGLLQGTDYLMVLNSFYGGNNCDFCLTIAPPPPVNDECTGAIPYPGDVVNGTCVTGYDFSQHFDSGISPSPFCDGGDANAWFTFTAPITTLAGDLITLQWDAGTTCFIGINVFETDCQTNISTCLNNNSGFLPGLVQGNNYLLNIWDDDPGGFNCDFCLTIPPPPPPGDECSDPLPYPGDIANSNCVTGFDFSGFSHTGISPALSCAPTQTTVWYTVTTPVTTAMEDPINLLFDGGYCALGAQFFSLDCSVSVSNCVSGSGLVSGLTQGTDYLMIVNNFYGGSICDFCVTVAPPPPPNDDCTGAIPYPGDVENGVCVTNLNLATSVDSGGFLPTCDGSNDPDVWYTWTAPVTSVAGEPIILNFDNGTGQANNCGLGIEFYALDCYTPLSNCLPNVSGTITGLTQGTDYLILVYDDGPGGLSCDFCLTIDEPGIVPDDLCNAFPLTLGEDCSLTFPYSNLGATPQIGEPIPGCYTEGSVEASVWFSFVAPPSGAVSITTDFFGSEMQDSQLALFELPTGDCSDLFTLNEIACSEDVMPFPINTDYNAGLPPLAVNPGQIYFIQVDGYNDYYGYLSQGDFCIVVSDSNPPPNDDCNNAGTYGGFGFDCTKIFNGTTFGASANGNADIFSCDGQEYNASVYYTFLTADSQVEFNLLTGYNINVTLFTAGCENGGVEVSGSCFTNINSSSDPNVLFTNLMPGNSYTMAIWTNEMQETDFSFCLTRPSYSCGDSYCYDLAENYSNCPNDCPCESEIFFYDYYSNSTYFFEAFGVCPEIINGTTDPNNPGLFVPFFIETNDLNLLGSSVTTDLGVLYAFGNPPFLLTNGEATNNFMYVFLTDAEIAAGGTVTITFTSDGGVCYAQKTFDISDLFFNSPDPSECGNCNLIVEVDYENAFCNGSSVTLDISFQNVSGYNICLRQDGDLICNNDYFLDPFGINSVNFPNSDLTFTVIDEGMPNCTYLTTFYAGDFICTGTNAACVDYYNTPTACRLEPSIAGVSATCNEDGTINIPVDLGRPTGAVTFNPDIVSGSGIDGDPYTVQVDLENCTPIDFTISDESTCDETPIVTVNSPPSIAGGITVATNADDWGVQIPIELGVCGAGGAVEGNVVTVNDGDTSGGQLTDFCEPQPPTLADPSVCTPLDGNIVLIDRGQCNFTQKVENAQNCNAIGVIICNCQPGPGWCAATADVLTTMASGGNPPTINIPAVFMLYSDCERIKMELNNGNDVNLCIGAPETLAGCEREFTLDVCNDFSTVACDDGECTTENDVATVDANGNEICACAGTTIECAAGEIFNDTTCMCEPDDGPCEEEIAGSVSAPDPGCDVSGIEVIIMAPDGSSITVTTDASGNFMLPGLYPCGIYSATIITPPMDLPDCYTATGTIGPIQFEVDGEGNGDDGPYFTANPEIPTLSQWGLIVLALLMMTFGAISLGGNIFLEKIRNT